MIDDTELETLLTADAERRAQIARDAKPAVPSAETLSKARELGLRLMGGFLREARPVVDALRAQLAPHGYELSPLHPTSRTGSLGLQTEFSRADGTGFAPLLFALDDQTGELRVFVQQFGGRHAPDFAERRTSVQNAVDVAWLNDALRDYVACMLRPRVAA